jgi:hypothetical protein
MKNSKQNMNMLNQKNKQLYWIIGYVIIFLNKIKNTIFVVFSYPTPHPNKQA